MGRGALAASGCGGVPFVGGTLAATGFGGVAFAGVAGAPVAGAGSTCPPRSWPVPAGLGLTPVRADAAVGAPGRGDAVDRGGAGSSAVTSEPGAAGWCGDAGSAP